MNFNKEATSDKKKLGDCGGGGGGGGGGRAGETETKTVNGMPDCVK